MKAKCAFSTEHLLDIYIDKHVDSYVLERNILLLL